MNVTGACMIDLVAAVVKGNQSASAELSCFRVSRLAPADNWRGVRSRLLENPAGALMLHLFVAVSA
jgi:hypothetical protein